MSFIWTAVPRAAANASIIGGRSLGVIETDDDVTDLELEFMNRLASAPWTSTPFFDHG
ncbi:hypothetical protein [Bradyrhizobium valentinum]|uniref:hypothetical protein n=1 Tax=Bradyrhizobium valentinum TaxID=1518501 RepID=UPI0018D200F0|nr:hypothetical protein [Bradyrhizobium valentinum]